MEADNRTGYVAKAAVFERICGLQTIAYLMASLLVSSTAAILATSLILSTTAGDAAQRSSQKAMQSVGHMLSS